MAFCALCGSEIECHTFGAPHPQRSQDVYDFHDACALREIERS